ncbi:hypothetical protein DFJ67_3522 [Asanoa ferruginea]|uniref:Uncharacterized protein n=1 Tax=Asanoa ferruginea TaxID=53367 RepID=A0A3D9ZJZ2_9ACTN|nr:hypothetical protein [Asanoa ferruginea]REF97521.1 hypothetical protein DFJ67_3522 [Asanoa ferruginea]GIF48191.1 hypothetical protein Afe04nite_27300 [Asanoa ferruginea]
MTDPVGALLTELADAMQGVATPFTRADAADRIYEGFLFAQVIATAAECGGRVIYEDCYEKEVQDLVFRGAPGVIHGRGRRSFTHAVLYFGAARPIEVHLRVKVQWKNFDGESDVLLIDTNAARHSRDKRQLPKPSGCVLTIEGKYYPLGVPRDEALKYVGMRRSFPPSMASLFVTNSFSTHARKCLSHANRLPFEFGAMPGTRFQTYVRAHIREAFKAWVAEYDFGHEV